MTSEDCDRLLKALEALHKDFSSIAKSLERLANPTVTTSGNVTPIDIKVPKP